jgi:hypothetical protein
MASEAFVVMEVKGSTAQAVGFVQGFLHGSGHPGPVWFAGREQFDTKGFLNSLREQLQTQTRVILPADLAERMRTRLDEDPLVDVKVDQVLPITGAALAFTFKCFTRDLAAEVRGVLQEIPEGVSLEGFEEKESEDPGAKGTELYSPVHEYTLEGKGRYEGAVAGLLVVAGRLAEHACFNPEKIHLETAKG